MIDNLICILFEYLIGFSCLVVVYLFVSTIKNAWGKSNVGKLPKS